ncbi:hypothetical protein PIB30_055956 [Stylosanthes scabra]|uniref:Uncharacterized protein n=1 Tax=Stylosanthes scabra TaxID=79078 RepID=A0ABU6RK47_9FABA|nr:hypothetical protein [Stylosanthes scabra]
MRESQKRIESQLNHLTEMLQKFTSQQVQPQPPAPSSLPSQPLPNQKGSIIVVCSKGINEDENEDEDVEWLYELLAKLADLDDEEDDESEEESDEEDEMKATFFIATFFNDKEIKEEVPVKCNDPGPCLVTCKIKGVEVRECLCDPRACSSVMPYELYKFLKLGTLKETKEIFTTADASVESVVGIAENVLVLSGRPFLKTAEFKLIYYDEIFTFSVGNAIEIFHPTPPPKPRKKSLHQLQESKGKKAPRKKEKARKEKEKKKKKRIPNPEKGRNNKKKLEDGKKKKNQKKKKNNQAKEEPDKATIKCSSFGGLLGKIKGLKKIFRQNKGADAYLVKPSGQRGDKRVQTSYTSLTKARIIKVSRNDAALVSSISCPSRKHSHVNPSAKEMPNLSNGGGRHLQGRYKASLQAVPADRRAASDSEHEKDKNLEAGSKEALLLAEDGAEETLPKNNVYAILWAILDAELENEAEEIPGQWDLDGILNNWGKIEPNVGPAGNDQGPLPIAN